MKIVCLLTLRQVVTLLLVQISMLLNLIIFVVLRYVSMYQVDAAVTAF